MPLVKFLHGVASGDPLPDAVVLWTRVTPTDDATPGSGTGPSVNGTWQVSTNELFVPIAQSGTFSTSTARDHTVKVDATGLDPATTYYFRFKAEGATSPVGRTRTAPAADAAVPHLKFGVVSCANYQAGYFSAYRHLAAHDLDAVLHLGDYIYEYADGEYGMGKDNVQVRKLEPSHEILTLADYRQRHALYKADPDLALLHATFPFITTWDDHEVANDTTSTGAENHQPTEGDFIARRAAAQQAYDEWQPIRLSGTAELGDGTQVYRRLTFGKLAEISLLDLRTYRVGTGSTFGQIPSSDNPNRHIAGDEQLGWLESGLVESGSQWKLIGNPVMISPVLVPPLPNDIAEKITDPLGLLPGAGIQYNSDQWDGYTTERRRVVEFLADRGVQDTVFLTGDIHSAWACELPVDPGLYPLSTTVATELVCTSVTSNNLKDILGTPARSALSQTVETLIKTANRHIKYLDFDSHGFSILDVTPARAQMDWYVISDRANRAATAKWSTSWAVPAAATRVEKTTTPVAAGA